jgi:nitric oxide reductase NorD protein
MFEPDEFIFTKLANYFKRNNKRKADAVAINAAKLSELKPRFTLIARALSGLPIEIFEAEGEGGYKNNNYFLPTQVNFFNTIEENIVFYKFRILYLSCQQVLNLNWNVKKEYSLEDSRLKAGENSSQVLALMFDLYPITKDYYELYNTMANDVNLTRFSHINILGKWMVNDLSNNENNTLNNFSDKVKTATEDVKTIIKAKAVEEIISKQIDKKQLDDAVLQHQFEKVETAEEFGGNWRDMDGEDELDDHENALEDLKMKYTVRVDEMTHSVYQSDFVENTTIAESKEVATDSYYIEYDEWDGIKRKYKENFCKLYPTATLSPNQNYYKKTLKTYKSTLLGIQKSIATLNNKYTQQRRQIQGEEFDIDAITDLYVDVNSGHTPSENIYLSKRKKEKDISILILLDVSLSSDGYANDNRIIDVEKQVSILFGEILNEANIDFSINCFYSKTRNHSTYITAKGFDEDWNKAKFKLGDIEPCGYTRIGVALRHSGELLKKRKAKNKWLILISDGKPNDYDKYEGSYGINDVKQALRELNQNNINSFALAIEAQAKYYLPQMFGQNHYQILTTPQELLVSLVTLFEKIRNKN